MNDKRQEQKHLLWVIRQRNRVASKLKRHRTGARAEFPGHLVRGTKHLDSFGLGESTRSWPRTTPEHLIRRVIDIGEWIACAYDRMQRLPCGADDALGERIEEARDEQRRYLAAAMAVV